MSNNIDNETVAGQTASGRLTPKWTDTLEEAFGEKGARGREAELFVKKVIESWGWEVIDHEQDYQKQIAGIDLSIRKPSWSNFYDVDVKANMNEYGTFWIEVSPTGWLFNPKKKNHRVWHVNVDTGWMAWYDREKMKVFIEDSGLKGEGCVKMTPTMTPPFVTRSKAYA